MATHCSSDIVYEPPSLEPPCGSPAKGELVFGAKIGDELKTSVLYKVSGMIIRVHLCWNFGRLVPGTLKSHRYQTI